MLFSIIKIVLFFIWGLSLLSMSACSSSSSGSSDTETTLQLSVTSAKAGEFISVEHDSIVADSPAELLVSYPGSNQNLSINSAYSDEGVARFVVPPFFDSNTNTYTGGSVRFSLANTTAAADFQIETPTDLGLTPPGYIMAWMMGLSRDKYASAIDLLDAKALEYGVDVTNLQAQLTEHIALLDASIAEIETLGRLTMVLDDGTVYVLGAEELRQNDQLFFSFAEGFAQEYQTLVPNPVIIPKTLNKLSTDTTGNTNLAKVTMDDLPPHVREFLEKSAEGLRWASDNGGKLGSALLGAVGIVVTIKGSIIGLPIIFVGAVGYVIVDGAVGEGLNSLANKLTLNNSDGYQFGDQLLESAEESLESMLLTLGGAKSKIVDFIGTVFNGKSIYDALGIEKCDALEEPQQKPNASNTMFKILPATKTFEEDSFCTELETSGLSIPVIGPLMLAPGEAGGWPYAIYGGTAPYHLLVSWGDGSETSLSNAQTRGVLSHTYTDNGQYIISLSATSNDGDTGAAATLVWVESYDSISARITIDGYFTNYNFLPDLTFAGFGSISDGNNVLMDEIPTIVGYRGAINTFTMEVMSMSISKDLAPPILPYTITSFSDDTDDFLTGVSPLMMNYATPQVTDETTGSQVVFSAIGGSLIIDEYGNQLSDRISGRFNFQLRGERNLCPDPPECDVVAEEIIFGTAEGEFNGTLKLEEDYSVNPTP